MNTVWCPSVWHHWYPINYNLIATQECRPCMTYVNVQQTCKLDAIYRCYLKPSLKLHCYRLPSSKLCIKCGTNIISISLFTLLIMLIELLARRREGTRLTKKKKKNRPRGPEKSTCCCLLALGVSRYIMVTFQDMLISNKIEAPLSGVQAIHWQTSGYQHS